METLSFVDGVVRYVIRSVGIGVELPEPEAIPLSELHPEQRGGSCRADSYNLQEIATVYRLMIVFFHM